MGNERLFVENFFNNIVVVNPNKVYNQLNEVEDRNVSQENLVIYANLQCSLQPRSRLIKGEDFQEIQTIAASRLNFLNPNNQDYFSTNWTDLQSQHANPNVINSELLGITNISYKCGASFIPTVDITLEDIRGRSLFESGDESIYSVFINLPYPTFYLTLKGFYGKSIKYPLILQKFQASFDQSSGNFLITLNFLGYKYNVLTDIQEAYVRALPNMYAREVTQNLEVQTQDSTSTDISVSQINGSDVATNTQILYKGYETLKTVYEIYIEKGLLPKGFPPLTIQQLITKLENFEKKILTSLGNISLEKLTDAKEFDKILTEFNGKIDTYTSTPSWKNKYLDTKNFYLILDSDGVYRKIYTYKSEYLTALKVDEVISGLNATLKEGIDRIDNAATFGSLKGKGNDVITTRMKSDFVIITPFTQPSEIVGNALEIAKKRTGKENPSAEVTKVTGDLLKLSEKYSTIITERQSLIDSGSLKATTPEFPLFFRLEGEKFFLGEIGRLRKVLETIVNVIQGDLTQEINLLLKSSKGIGFEPSIRNVIGVIMASTDAFLRIMDEVHRNAFDARDNVKKKNAVRDDIGGFPDSPVFPWPQFNVQEFAEDGKITYDLKYPGDPKYVSLTSGNDYNAWPEVEFVEEFVKGYVLRDQEPLQVEVDSPDSSVTRLLISGFDVLDNKSYSTNQYVSFLYEIWERYIAISQYQGFQRQGDVGFGSILNFLAAFEASNLIKGIGSDNPDLVTILKQIDFTPTTFEDYLKQISSSGVNVAWQKYISGQFYTEYLESEIISGNKILIGELPNVDATISTETNATEVEKEMEKYLKRDDKNIEYYTDTFPYVFPSWNEFNLYNGANSYSLSKVYRTSSTIFYNQDIKKLVNWDGGKPDNNKIRPFTFFPVFTTPVDYSQVETDISLFYLERYNSEKKAYTEKRIVNRNSNIGAKTTSIINTQAFVNSIVDGVTRERNGIPFAYRQSAYLFLNSLPLSTLSNQYIDDDGGRRNYIGVTLKKYGAIHNLPKLWIAKIGSIWHRYKEYIETGIDFISSSTQPFNFNFSYDPVGSDPNRTYTFLSGSTPFNITLRNPQIIGFPPTATTFNIVNQGFYPNLLNDFYYFLNGENLYQDPTSIELDIQQKINLGEVEIFTNSESQIVKSPLPTNNLTEGVVSIPYSVLFRDKSFSEDGKIYYYTAPSFGSLYNQSETECFSGPNLTHDFLNNNAVLNGSIRIAWGIPNFGYVEDVLSIGGPMIYPFNNNFEGNSVDFGPTADDSGIFDESTGNIVDLFGTFTKQELDIFELEFLNFSQQSDNVTNNFNLQEVLKKSLRLEESDVLGDNTNSRLKNIQTKQYTNFNSYINKLINENYLYQRGNPNGLNFRDLSYFSSNPKNLLSGTIDTYVSKTPNTLPYPNGFISVEQSKQLNPNQWIALETYVGVIDIDGLRYTDTGSTITDFFIDLNVAFTVENIQRFAQIIKIYATKKLTQDFSVTSFQNLTNQFLNDCNILRNNIFTNAFPKIKKFLPNTTVTSFSNIEDSATEGGITKIEYYNLFKAINDKWIAGNNYNNETLFEDILFLDRANRDVGDKVIVDIFKVVDYLKNNPKRNIYTVITSIGQDNNFVNFSIPAYINFYNIQKVGKGPSEPEDPATIAEKLFGTFTEVDYQDSQTKLIFQYAELPSEQLKNPSEINGYNDDSFNLGVAVDNPLVEDENPSNPKTDVQKALSNKVVGFAVDFGSQNQGVFQNVQVSQDLGKATSESLQMEFDAANTLRGTRSYTQSVGLYNIYKSRSYSSTVTAFGNVMIQPTMYFVLRNVPLFAGPYFITEVEHTISGMDFKTKFVGTRQRIYTPPIDNPLLGTIKKNLLQKLVNRLVTKRQNDSKVASTTQSFRDNLATSLVSTPKPDLSSNCKTTATYSTFTKTTATKKNESSSNIWGTIYNSYGSSGNSVYMIYTLFYVESYVGSNFTFYNNNLTKTPIGTNSPSYGAYAKGKFNPEFICLKDDNNVSEAYATFKSVEDCVDFTYNRYLSNFQETLKNIDNESLFVSGFTKNWIEKVPYDKIEANKAPELYESFQTTYPEQFADLESKVRRSYLQVRKFLGL
jgi:hypothetical protein